MIRLSADRIYLNPPKFWATTKNMTDKDVEQLMNQVLRLAKERRFDELRRYNFIFFGHKRAASAA